MDKLEKVLARLVDKNKALYSKIFLSDDEELKSLLTDLYEESRSVGYDDGYEDGRQSVIDEDENYF